MATARLRATLARMAVADERSPLYGVRVEDLDFQDGAISSRNGNVGESLTDILARGAAEGVEAEGESAATQLQSLAVTSMGYGAVFVEVGVDAELGEIRVRRVCGAFAAGRILNPLLARSQYVGGLIGGIGMALHERTVTDRASGRIVGDTLADYLIPVHADMPEFDIAMIDEEEPVAKLFRIPLKSRQCIWNQTYCFQVQCYKIFRFPLDLVTVLFRFDHPDSQQQA
jgi:xanthine dehydrogenase YagR molybdenum-binding subunit